MSRMLKHVLLFAAVVVVANGLALLIAARNASGRPDAEITLTEREARLMDTGPENSAVMLSLEWDGQVGRTPLPWFNAARLASIGYDCSVDPRSAGAAEHYRGPAFLPRPAYVALTVRAGAPTDERLRTDQVPWERVRGSGGVPWRSEQERQQASRLVVTDAGSNPVALRRAYPDRTAVFITRGFVRLSFVPAGSDGPAHLEGQVTGVEPFALWVPRSLQGPLASIPPSPPDKMALPLEHDPRYAVTVRYGRDLIPTVVGVRPLK
jgi:hypothetical protein